MGTVDDCSSRPGERYVRLEEGIEPPIGGLGCRVGWLKTGKHRTSECHGISRVVSSGFQGIKSLGLNLDPQPGPMSTSSRSRFPTCGCVEPPPCAKAWGAAARSRPHTQSATSPVATSVPGLFRFSFRRRDPYCVIQSLNWEVQNLLSTLLTIWVCFWADMEQKRFHHGVRLDPTLSIEHTSSTPVLPRFTGVLHRCLSNHLTPKTDSVDHLHSSALLFGAMSSGASSPLGSCRRVGVLEPEIVVPPNRLDDLLVEAMLLA